MDLFIDAFIYLFLILCYEFNLAFNDLIDYIFIYLFSSFYIVSIYLIVYFFKFKHVFFIWHLF